jgi:hypothetical protein
MRKQIQFLSVEKEGTSLHNQATGAARMATEIKASTPPTKRSKIQVLFYMDAEVIKELKHQAVDQNKSYSQFAEDLIVAGLKSDGPPKTS